MAHPSSGQLQPYGEQIIEVSAYSDMWGNYHDNLILTVCTLIIIIIILFSYFVIDLFFLEDGFEIVI